MIELLLWSLAFVLMTGVVYALSYIWFRRKIIQQTKQMVSLMKSEDVDNMQIGDIYLKASADFSELERAALYLRRKYLRLRRQSQEERRGYETVFSGLKEGIVSVDQNLKIIYFNEAFMSFFNWAPVKEHTNYFLHDVIRDPQVISTFKKTFEAGEVRRTDVDQFQLFVTPLPSRNESELWSLGVFYDLSEIRKTEKIRIDFVANASHEMRTPLTVIKGYSELLKQKLEDEPSSAGMLDLLTPILQSTDQMSELMNELLNLSKVEVGHAPEKRQLSTRQLTDDVVNEIAGLGSLNQKVINIDILTETVMGHDQACRQILKNLLTNAIKYSGEANEILVKWYAENDSVFLSVKDSGPGVPREHQNRIFERFYRVDKGRSRDQGGFGLGLALVKHHILNHGGNVRLISENSTGSEFICEFPNK